MEKNKNNKKSIFENINLSTQNKLIFLGWFVSSVLVIVIATFVISNIQKKLYDGYYNFGLMLAKTLAIESVDLTSEIPAEEKYNILRAHAMSIIKKNEDISHISFSDNDGNLLYSSTQDIKPKENAVNKININTPMYSNSTPNHTIGSVQVGLTGKTITEVRTTTRNSMLIIFTFVWAIFMFAVYMYTLLITRQINILADGVKKISTGAFGYKIDPKEVSGEIKQLFNAFNDMSIRLRQYEEKNIDQLTYERNKLEAVLMSIANGVIVCDNHDKIILVNNAALRTLEAEQSDIINTKIYQYSDLEGHLCFQEKIEKFKDTPIDDMESKPLEFNVDINGKVIKTIISPMFNINEEYIGYIIITHDITKEAEIDKIKNNFISNVSHELRTPVTVLRSYIDTLCNYGKEFDYDTQKEFLDTINQEADRLNKMVNDILDFSRLEQSSMELEKTYTNIVPLIELTVASVKVLAEEKQLMISVIIEPDLPEVFINPESIERALKNLLSNAIKYSFSGGKIKLRAELDRNNEFLEISVEDNGIGIPEKHLGKIFNRFYRVENNTHSIKGTGLGLHLVKMAIEKHHEGEVFVLSRENEGSTFGFRLPLGKPVETTKPKEQPQQEPVKEKAVHRVEKVEEYKEESHIEPEDGGAGWEFSIEK